MTSIEELEKTIAQYEAALTALWVTRMGSLAATGLLPEDLVREILRAWLILTTSITETMHTLMRTHPGIRLDPTYRINRLEKFMSPTVVRQVGFTQVQLGIKQAVEQVKTYRAQVSDFGIEQKTSELRAEAGERGDEWGVMWVAHRDCCVRCLAYSGLTSTANGVFPGGLSFNPEERDLTLPGVTGPPLHPHERCHLELVHLPTIGPASKALKREAERAALKGWALPSEEDQARREAAKFVLTNRSFPPKTVRADAHRRLNNDSVFRRPAP